MKKVVIIGADATGLKAASKIRKSDSKAQITVIDKSDFISYGACGMPYYISGEIDHINKLMLTSDGVMRDAAYFKKTRDITVQTKRLATKIDREKKMITVKNLLTKEESLLPYDKLVIAAGASPAKPSLPGIELGNVHQFWHPSDAIIIHQGLEEGKFTNAVVVGAGLVGMEMAAALKSKGLNVTVIIRKDRVFTAFLDEDIARQVTEYVREKGIHVVTSENVQQFFGDTVVTGVQTDKQTIPADLVILTVGINPNVELARAAGLEIGVTGAISVNAHMQTSDPDIYAGGDCVETTNMITGKKVYSPLGSVANKHGRVIGENICGYPSIFHGVLNTAIVKVMNLTVGKVGLNERDAQEHGYQYAAVTIEEYDRPHYMPEAKLITLKLIADVKTRKVLGAQAFGEGEVAKRIDVLAAVLTLGGTLDDLIDMDLAYAPPFSNPIDNVAVAAGVLMNKLDK